MNDSAGERDSDYATESDTEPLVTSAGPVPRGPNNPALRAAERRMMRQRETGKCI